VQYEPAGQTVQSDWTFNPVLVPYVPFAQYGGMAVRSGQYRERGQRVMLTVPKSGQE
jgi:hypothetical protein